MGLKSGGRHAGRTGVYPGLARLRSAAGQTTTEWLMIAGGLTAIGIFLTGILPRTIRQFCEALVWSIRTISP